MVVVRVGVRVRVRVRVRERVSLTLTLTPTLTLTLTMLRAAGRLVRSDAKNQRVPGRSMPVGSQWVAASAETRSASTWPMHGPG